MTTRRATALVLGCLLLLPGFRVLAGRGRSRVDVWRWPGCRRIRHLRHRERVLLDGRRDRGRARGGDRPEYPRLGAAPHGRGPAGSGRPATGPAAGCSSESAPAEDVAAYLAGVAHDQVTGAAGANVDYRRIGGRAQAQSPGSRGLLGQLRQRIGDPHPGLGRDPRRLGRGADECRRIAGCPRRRDSRSQGRLPSSPVPRPAGAGCGPRRCLRRSPGDRCARCADQPGHQAGHRASRAVGFAADNGASCPPRRNDVRELDRLEVPR